MEAWPQPKSLNWDYATPCAWESVKCRRQPLRSHALPHTAAQVSSFHSPGVQCKDYYSEEEGATRSSKLVETECMEYISALAAGNQARSMVDIESGGMSPSILALAAAARQTGGRLVCLRHEQAHLEALRRQIESLNLEDVVECKRGEPLESIRQLESVDFAVVDHRLEFCRELVSAIDVNPRGSVVVVSNLFHGRRATASYGQLVKERAVAKSVVLPFGEGMEVTRVGRAGKHGCHGGRRVGRKFVVYYEDSNVVI
ncbi:hypothetical protein BHE74_00008191 [Ensete ventricosum]|nr:hypothetical protein BHE74_00008191 [Ensete ventricosum]